MSSAPFRIPSSAALTNSDRIYGRTNRRRASGDIPTQIVVMSHRLCLRASERPRNPGLPSVRSILARGENSKNAETPYATGCAARFASQPDMGFGRGTRAPHPLRGPAKPHNPAAIAADSILSLPHRNELTPGRSRLRPGRHRGAWPCTRRGAAEPDTDRFPCGSAIRYPNPGRAV